MFLAIVTIKTCYEKLTRTGQSLSNDFAHHPSLLVESSTYNPIFSVYRLNTFCRRYALFRFNYFTPKAYNMKKLLSDALSLPGW